MHAVRPSFMIVTQKMHPITALITCLRSLVPDPDDQRLKTLGLAKLQHHLRARHPISVFVVNKMADDIEHAPSTFTCISECPSFRSITQKRIESSGGAGEKRYCVVQAMFHHAPQFVVSHFPESLIVVRGMRQRSTLDISHNRCRLIATIKDR